MDGGRIEAADDGVHRRDPAGLEGRRREQRGPRDERDGEMDQLVGDEQRRPATASRPGRDAPTAGRPRAGRGRRSAPPPRSAGSGAPSSGRSARGARRRRRGRPSPARRTRARPGSRQIAVIAPWASSPRSASEPWPDFARTIDPVWNRKSALRWARTSHARTRTGSVIGRTLRSWRASCSRHRIARISVRTTRASSPSSPRWARSAATEIVARLTPRRSATSDRRQPSTSISQPISRWRSVRSSRSSPRSGAVPSRRSSIPAIAADDGDPLPVGDRRRQPLAGGDEGRPCAGSPARVPDRPRRRRPPSASARRSGWRAARRTARVGSAVGARRPWSSSPWVNSNGASRSAADRPSVRSADRIRSQAVAAGASRRDRTTSPNRTRRGHAAG